MKKIIFLMVLLSIFLISCNLNDPLAPLKECDKDLTSQRSCYVYETIKLNNSSICNLLNNPLEISQCYLEYAVLQNDPSVCEFVHTRLDIDENEKEVIVESDSADTVCYLNFAFVNKDPTICNLDKNHSLTCFVMYAEKNNYDPNTCTSLNSSDKELCEYLIDFSKPKEVKISKCNIKFNYSWWDEDKDVSYFGEDVVKVLYKDDYDFILKLVISEDIGITIDEYIRYVGLEGLNSYMEDVKSPTGQQIYVNGIKAYELKYAEKRKDDSYRKVVEIIFIENGNFCDFSFVTSEGQMKYYEEYIEEIKSSIELIN